MSLRNFFSFLSLCLLIALPIIAAAQSDINHTDALGRKQGPWERRYPNGRLMYQGSFLDDKPSGTWRRWHEGGSLKAVMEYFSGSDSVKATLYESASSPVAAGYYSGEKKTGTWEYFSNGRKIAEEEFSDGLRQGTSRKYYPTGELLEESQWVNDRMEGKYLAFFTSGKPFLKCRYHQGERHGNCISYYASGTVEVVSPYRNDLPDGEWIFFSEKGDTLYTLQYSMGKLLNPEVLLTFDTQKLEELEKQRDRLTDPEKYLEDPEAYEKSRKYDY